MARPLRINHLALVIFVFIGMLVLGCSSVVSLLTPGGRGEGRRLGTTTMGKPIKVGGVEYSVKSAKSKGVPHPDTPPYQTTYLTIIQFTAKNLTDQTRKLRHSMIQLRSGALLYDYSGTDTAAFSNELDLPTPEGEELQPEQSVKFVAAFVTISYPLNAMLVVKDWPRVTPDYGFVELKR